ncbi:SRPBCC family protein [Micromonospora sp. NBC_01796]|uniref:SRPBCC family protein n=1 Tax=Micromonospora sp. NBC_01796 TaxID=2975987 RepID=UPI002DDC3EF8|nr:SRPBCC domain-containing protein [Micromonospora sp. NBC_01796]WSA85770.1 SRPBCC domain-containing protein [Micromonospora sp. NBC_01796]
MVGGPVTETWAGPDGNPVHTRGAVTALVANELLRLRWADEGWDDSTEVEFRLLAGDHGTVVHVREHGLDRHPDGARLTDEHRAGWRTHLSNLRRCVEARSGR